MTVKLPPVRETAILRACLQWLQLRGIVAWRNNSGVMRVPDANRKRGALFVNFCGVRGASDIVGYIPARLNTLGVARFLAVEVKSTTGRLTDDQRAFLDEVDCNGGVSLVVRNVDELEVALQPYLKAVA